MTERKEVNGTGGGDAAVKIRGEHQKRVNAAVDKFLNRKTKPEFFTSITVAEKLNRDRRYVTVALRNMERNGIIERIGTKKQGSGRGRSAIVYSTND